MSIHLVNEAPEGTKMWLLHVGNCEVDEGWMLRGAGSSTFSDPNPASLRRQMVFICVLIEHPTEGLLLFETGTGKDYPTTWGPQLSDVFARVDHRAEYELDAAIAKTGHDIKDIKAIIMGHLHLDHAGGLEYFIDTDVPIYIHEKELKHAFYSVATKSDLGPYLAKDLRVGMNWQAIHGDHLELAQGIDIILSPGHTPGLCIMQVNLKNSGTWIITTDQYHVRENFEASQPQGWLARDHDDWVRSHAKIRALQKRTNGKMVFGHCRETLMQYKLAPEYYD